MFAPSSNMVQTTIRALRRAASSATAPPPTRLVLGSGSNVMDLFFPMRMLPKPGDKTYFALETCVGDSVVGGVTLNHLAWARALGVPTGLLAFQGTDANGQAIRRKMAELGVSSEFVRVSDKYSTSVSHILSGPDGERTILMAPASTSRLTGEVVRAEFAGAVAGRAAMVTTEISQLPLSGVEFLLDAAIAAQIPSLLDVDVPPAVATGPARLGSLDELRRCVAKAQVLKLTASAAGELLALVSDMPLESRLENIAQQLADAFGSRMCVVTDGSDGSALALGRKVAGGDGSGGTGTAAAAAKAAAAAAASRRAEAVLVPICKGVTQRDATGAGDAFFGGIVASVFHKGVPTTTQGLLQAGSVAAAAGGACVEVVGALPVGGVSAQRMAALCELAGPFAAAAHRLDVEAGITNAGGSDKQPAYAAAAAAAAAAASATPAKASHQNLYGAWLNSLLKDGDALNDAASHYTLHIATQTDAVAALITALRRAAVPSGGGGAAASASAGAGAGGTADAAAVTAAVHCTGVGKSGAVAARLAMSLRSVGVRAAFVHGSEWHHGDLGGAARGDVALVFSHSGRTAELVDVAVRLRAKGLLVVAVTGDASSALARTATRHFAAPAADELLGCVPSRSVVAQEAVANALMSALVEALGLTREGFGVNHPGGSIGAAAAKAAGTGGGTAAAGAAGAGAAR